MVVADNEIDAETLGIRHQRIAPHAAIECNDETEALLSRIVDALFGNAVAFLVPVGDIILNPRIKGAEELIYDRHGSGAIHIVIAIDKDSLLAADGEFDARNGLLHVLHQERIVQMVETGFEETLYLLRFADVALQEDGSEFGMQLQAFRKGKNLLARR